MDNQQQKLNQHLIPIFEEVLPALANAGIKYWVFGGIGIAGIVGKFLRENKDVDVYVQEEDFLKAEPVLKRLCEEHGSWDADGWDLRYSMLKNNGRPKFDIFIKKVEHFSLVPVYKIEDGVEFRVLETFRLPNDALTQDLKTVDGFQFFSPPKDVLLALFRSLIERYIIHYNKPTPIDENSKHLIDARAVFSKEEVDEYIQRFNQRAKSLEMQTP